MTYPDCIDKAPLLKKAWRVMRDHKWHGSLVIHKATDTVAVGSCMADLRKKGFTVLCKRRKGFKKNRFIYKLQLTPTREGELPPTFSGPPSLPPTKVGQHRLF